MTPKFKFLKIVFLTLLFFMFFCIFLNLKNYKNISSSYISPNLWTKVMKSDLYHFSIFFKKRLTPVKESIIIFYPTKHSILKNSHFLKKFWGIIPDILMYPSITKKKSYNSKLDLDEQKYLKNNIISSFQFKKNIFNYIFLHDSWRNEKNWAIFEYYSNKTKVTNDVYLLPINWRDNLSKANEK